VHDRSPDNWKPLLKISASAGTWLGLSAQAEWEVATSPCGPGRSLADASWVPAWPLLERDPDTIISTLTRATFGHPDVPPLPIDDLVASAMGSGMEYLGRESHSRSARRGGGTGFEPAVMGVADIAPARAEVSIDRAFLVGH
jgi:hypothetical protein